MNTNRLKAFGCAVILFALMLIPCAKAADPPRRGKTLTTAHSAVTPGQSSTILPDGDVLLLGGEGAEGPIATAGIQNPRTGEFKPLPSSMLRARAWHSATVLPDGTVLIFGGTGAGGRVVETAEVFDPATEQFTSATPAGVTVRAHHTATVLTDGTVLFAGGVAGDGQRLASAQIWDFRTNATTSAHSLIIARSDHRANLLADGTVLLWGGKDTSGSELNSGEIYDPRSQQFLFQASPPAKGQGPVQIAETIPEGGSQDVGLNVLIAVRFSLPVAAQSVTSAAVYVAGPDGSIPAKVVPAEGGMLVFVSPKQSLAPATSYTVEITGVSAIDGSALPESSFNFSTIAGNGSATAGSSGEPANSRYSQLPPLQAPPGITAISGRVLLQNGLPLKRVTLRVGGRSAETDRTGRFLLTGVPIGNDLLVIDGRSASNKKATYGVFEVGVPVFGGQTNVLNYTIWMPVIDTAHAVSLTFPTTKETTITTPLIPGLELQLPAGTTITDIDGKVASQVSITPIPVSQPPFPLPAGVIVPTYFTIQPGGGWISVSNPQGPKGGRLIYPNAYHEPPGTLFDFWNYSTKKLSWYVYGHGTVSADGQSVIPDPGVVIYELTGAMVGSPNVGPSTGPSNSGGGGGGGQQAAEPVDLATGLFVYNKLDLYEPDVIPIVLTRTYRQKDGATRDFGIGTQNGYDMYLVGDNNTFQYLDLVLADGSQINYTRTSPGITYSRAVFQAQSNPGPFFGSTLASCWTLLMKDGTNLHFPCIGGAPYQYSAVLSITDRHGNQLTITRDSNANISQITSPNGRWIKFTYDSSNRVTQAQDQIGRTVSYVYDSGGRLSQVTDANNGLWKYAYDSNNNMTSITDPRGIMYLQNQYDSNGRVTTQTEADGGVYQFAYQTTANGTITETDVTDPNGSVRKITFNPPPTYPDGFTPGGTPATITYAAGTPQQEIFTNQYQAGTNLLVSVTDPLSRTTSYTYDGLGNVTGLTQLASTQNAVSTSFAYDPNYNQLTSIADPLGRFTAFSLNSSGDPISITDPLGNISTLTYDSEGRIQKVVDAAGESTSFSYNGPDLTSVTDALNRITSFTADGAGRLLSVSTPMGHVTQYSYNPLNQVTSITDPLGGVTSITYDGNGNALSVTDAEHSSSPTKYTYDRMDRLQTRTDPLNNSENYAYDKNGNLTQFTDRRGKVTTYQWDALNRITFAGFGTMAGPSYESTASYTYDLGDRLTKAVDSIAGTFTRSYDGLDRLNQEQGPEGTLGYTYDTASRRTQMTVSGQQSPVEYDYDDDDNLMAIAQGSSNVSFTYDAVGRRTSLSLPNEIVVGYTFDLASEMTGLNYSIAGNVLGNLTYAYDGDSRRVQVGGMWARTNMPNPTTSTAVFNAGNQLTSWNGTTLAYDANGNLTNDGSNTYTWDARNHLASIAGGSSASFVYDPFGRRLAKVINGAATDFLYDGLNPVQELSVNTATANLLNGGLDEIFSRSDSTGTFSQLRDVLGSTVALTDANGNIQTSYTYDPLGKTSIAGSTSSNVFQYAGRENEGNGLYYYRARYYSPLLERFLSEDPMGFTANSVNFYEYVYDSPLNYVDPLGLQAMTPGEVGYRFQQFSDWLESVGTAWDMTEDFFTGSGPTYRDFGPGTVQTKDMMYTEGVLKALDYYRHHGFDPCDHAREVHGGHWFGPRGAWHAGLNPTEQFIGSYDWSIKPLWDGNFQITLINNTDVTSLMYHMGFPSWDRDPFGMGWSLPLGTTTQTYHWVVPREQLQGRQCPCQ